MPLHIDPAIIQQFAQRQAAQEQFEPQRESAAAPPLTTLNPTVAALIAAAADGATTYRFLHKGEAPEDNALFKGAHNNPAGTAALAAGSGLGVLALTRLLHSKLPALTDAVQGQMSATQLGTALNNSARSSQSSERAVIQRIADAIRQSPDTHGTTTTGLSDEARLPAFRGSFMGTIRP